MALMIRDLPSDASLYEILSVVVTSETSVSVTNLHDLIQPSILSCDSKADSVKEVLL
jgi:hypothetical protein